MENKQIITKLDCIYAVANGYLLAATKHYGYRVEKVSNSELIVYDKDTVIATINLAYAINKHTDDHYGLILDLMQYARMFSQRKLEKLTEDYTWLLNAKLKGM